MKYPIGATAILAGLISANVTAETLQDAVQKTIKENPDLQSFKDARLATEQQIDQARASFFPTIDLQGGYGFEQSDNPTTRNRGGIPGQPSSAVGSNKLGTVVYDRAESSIQLRQMLFDGLATPNEVSRTKAATNARAFLVYSQSEYRALEAVQAYLDVLRAEEQLRVAQDNFAAHLSTNDQITMRSEQGVGKRADINQSSARVSRAESNVRSAEGNLTDAKTRYLKVIGALPGKLEAPVHPDGKLPKNIDEAVEVAVANHPQLKSANADIDEAHYQHETASAPFMPRVDFESGASFNNNLDGIPGKNEDVTAMVRVRYNILNGGKDLARRKETAHQISQAKDIRDNTYREVVQNMRESWVAYVTRQSQLDLNKQYWENSIKAREAYQNQFNIGQRTLLDLLDTTNEMFTAESNYINSKYDELFAAYRILAAEASLNNYLGVALPEESKPLEN
ncbi:MAG: TolC family outer membrane protein [Methylomicrobium sp.]